MINKKNIIPFFKKCRYYVTQYFRLECKVFHVKVIHFHKYYRSYISCIINTTNFFLKNRNLWIIVGQKVSQYASNFMRYSILFVKHANNRFVFLIMQFERDFRILIHVYFSFLSNFGRFIFMWRSI